VLGEEKRRYRGAVQSASRGSMMSRAHVERFAFCGKSLSFFGEALTFTQYIE